MLLAKYQVIVMINGQDVSSRWNPLLEDLTITRASGETADNCDLKLADADGSTILPSERAEVQVIIRGDLAFMGYVSDVTYSWDKGGGSSLEISCSSVDQGGPAKEPKSSHKDDASLSDRASQLASKAGMSVTVAGSITSIQRKYWGSVNESFMSWGQRISKEIGASFKILGKQAYLVAINEGISSSGKPLTPIAAVRGQNLISGSISPIISRPKFKDVEVSYFDIAKGEKVKKTVPSGISDVDANLRSVISAADEDQANSRASAAGKQSDREKGAGSVTILGNVLAEPEALCMISGVRPGIDGSYRISSVTHKISKGSGFQTDLDLRQPQDGAGVDSR